MAREFLLGSALFAAGVAMLIGSASHALAQTTIATQDFNALSSSFTSTTASVASGQPLPNQGSLNSGGPGIDFESFWVQTRANATGPISLPDTSDFIGVNGASVNGLPAASPTGAAVGAAGDHNYEFNDSDGRIDVEFEAVDMSGYQDREITLFYWVGTSDNYEGGDRFIVRVTDGANTYTALDQNAAALQANRACGSRCRSTSTTWSRTWASASS